LGSCSRSMTSSCSRCPSGRSTVWPGRCAPPWRGWSASRSRSWSTRSAERTGWRRPEGAALQLARRGPTFWSRRSRDRWPRRAPAVIFARSFPLRGRAGVQTGMIREPAQVDERRVLVVDDDLAIRELLAEGLLSFGYPTVTASGPDEALRIVQQEPLRLMLSDIDMPGGNGIELLGRVKAVRADLDVIMVTGAVDADTAIQAIRQGASDYVTKPFNLEEVQIVVERTLEKRRLILENRAHQEHLEGLVALRTKELLE